MFKVRSDQMKAFDKKALQLFEDEMWEHCQEFAPKLCAVAREERVRKVIKSGIAKAESYGFTNRGPVRFIIDLMFSFGCEFDTDPQHVGWQSALHARSNTDQTLRAEKLFQDYKRFCSVTIGENHTLLVAALNRIDALTIEQLHAFGSQGCPGIEQLFKDVYPERFGEIGTQSASETIKTAVERAEQLGSFAPVARSVSTGLTILIGHRYDIDPLYPWVGNVLGKKVHSDQRFRMLFEKAKVYLNEVSNYWKGA